MRSSRLLSMLMLLQVRQRVTARALADEFEVSERTIYRDIDALSAAGVPVYAERGPGGGFRLIEGYRTKLTGLDGAEAEALLLIGLPSLAKSMGIGSASAAARNKLLASLTPDRLGGAERLAGRFHLDPASWYHREEPVPFLPLLTRAVLDDRRVTIDYRSWNKSRRWSLAPLGLVLKAGAWYLVAQSETATMTFKVANILRCDLDDSTFARPSDFVLADHWTDSNRAFERRLKKRTATLRTTALGRERLAELGDYPELAAAPAEGDADLVIAVEEDAMAARQILNLGGEVEVLEPQSLRAAVADLAERIAAEHRLTRS